MPNNILSRRLPGIVNTVVVHQHKRQRTGRIPSSSHIDLSLPQTFSTSTALALPPSVLPPSASTSVRFPVAFLQSICHTVSYFVLFQFTPILLPAFCLSPSLHVQHFSLCSSPATARFPFKSVVHPPSTPLAQLLRPSFKQLCRHSRAPMRPSSAFARLPHLSTPCCFLSSHPLPRTFICIWAAGTSNLGSFSSGNSSVGIHICTPPSQPFCQPPSSQPSPPAGLAGHTPPSAFPYRSS